MAELNSYKTDFYAVSAANMAITRFVAVGFNGSSPMLSGGIFSLLATDAAVLCSIRQFYSTF